MVKGFHKKASKRITTRKRTKIERKVREHDRKVRKNAKNKKMPSKIKRMRKDPGIPNECPFKQDILDEAKRMRDDREKAKQEAKQIKKEARLLNKSEAQTVSHGIEELFQDAKTRSIQYEIAALEQQYQEEIALEPRESKNYKGNKKSADQSRKQYGREFKKVIGEADVILEVLDARDPLGSRCPQVEKAVIEAGPHKKLVLVLNKIDLVPKANVEQWLKYLRNELPTIAFKASTQENLGKTGKLSQVKVSVLKAETGLIKSSTCLGADTLMKLIANYSRSKDMKTAVRVGVVGFPNTGKSSIINSLKRGKACVVGNTPGVTNILDEADFRLAGRAVTAVAGAVLDDLHDVEFPTSSRDDTAEANHQLTLFILKASQPPGLTVGHMFIITREFGLTMCSPCVVDDVGLKLLLKVFDSRVMQAVQLDKNVQLLDCPGLVMADGSEGLNVLRNAVKVEKIDDPIQPIETLLSRCQREKMMTQYQIPLYQDTTGFINAIARRFGFIKKKGIPDREKAARRVLLDWNSGKISYYTIPPDTYTRSTHISAEVVTNMAQEFNIDELISEETRIITVLESDIVDSMVFDQAGLTKGMEQSESNMEYEAANEGGDMEEDEPNIMDLAKHKQKKQVTMVTQEDDKPKPTPIQPAQTATQKKKKGKSALSEFLPRRETKRSQAIAARTPVTPQDLQQNKQKKKEYKKMQKKRKRTDKLDNELCNALETGLAGLVSD